MRFLILAIYLINLALNPERSFHFFGGWEEGWQYLLILVFGTFLLAATSRMRNM